MTDTTLLRVWAREASDFTLYYSCTDFKFLNSICPIPPMTKMTAIDVHQFLRKTLTQVDAVLIQFLHEPSLQAEPFLSCLSSYFEMYDFLYPCDLVGIYADFRSPSDEDSRDILEEHFDLVSSVNIRNDVTVQPGYQYCRLALLFRDS